MDNMGYFIGIVALVIWYLLIFEPFDSAAKRRKNSCAKGYHDFSMWNDYIGLDLKPCKMRCCADCGKWEKRV